MRIAAANAQDRAQVGALAAEARAVAAESVEFAYFDQAYSGANPGQQAAAHGLKFEVIKLDRANRGFGLLAGRWVVEGSFD